MLLSLIPTPVPTPAAAFHSSCHPPCGCHWPQVSASGLQAGLKSLGAGGGPPRLLIIDDGWQRTDVDEEYRPAGVWVWVGVLCRWMEVLCTWAEVLSGCFSWGLRAGGEAKWEMGRCSRCRMLRHYWRSMADALLCTALHSCRL
jgi:hypothetical protein